jgi:hypothetical protein
VAACHEIGEISFQITQIRKAGQRVCFGLTSKVIDGTMEFLMVDAGGDAVDEQVPEPVDLGASDA